MLSKLDPTHRRCVIPYLNHAQAVMIRLVFSLLLAIAIAVTSAMARNRHRDAPATHNRCDAVLAAGPYVDYNPCKDPNAVFVGGTYAGSDPDPNIQAALIREFGRQKF